MRILTPLGNDLLPTRGDLCAFLAGGVGARPLRTLRPLGSALDALILRLGRRIRLRFITLGGISEFLLNLPYLCMLLSRPHSSPVCL